MLDISAYRLTVIAAMVVVVLSAGIVLIVGTPDEAKLYLGLVGTIAIPALLSLFKSEQNSQSIAQVSASHDEIRGMVAQIKETQDNDAAGTRDKLPDK